MVGVWNWTSRLKVIKLYFGTHARTANFPAHTHMGTLHPQGTELHATGLVDMWRHAQYATVIGSRVCTLLCRVKTRCQRDLISHYDHQNEIFHLSTCLNAHHEINHTQIDNSIIKSLHDWLGCDFMEINHMEIMK